MPFLPNAPTVFWNEVSNEKLFVSVGSMNWNRLRVRLPKQKTSEPHAPLYGPQKAGWPTLLFPINTEVAPPLRFLQGWAIRHIVPWALRHTLSHAQTSPTILRCRLLAFHHFQLLSTTCPAAHARSPHSVSQNSGTGAPPLLFRGGWLRRDMPEHFHLLIGEPEKGWPTLSPINAFL